MMQNAFASLFRSIAVSVVVAAALTSLVSAADAPKAPSMPLSSATQEMLATYCKTLPTEKCADFKKKPLEEQQRYFIETVMHMTVATNEDVAKAAAAARVAQGGPAEIPDPVPAPLPSQSSSSANNVPAELETTPTAENEEAAAGAPSQNMSLDTSSHSGFTMILIAGLVFFCIVLVIVIVRRYIQHRR